MIETRVICTHCSSERDQYEILCRKCSSPFIIDVEGPYEEKLSNNFPYVSRFIFEPARYTPISELGKNLMVKEEYLHPTLSYKDRGMNVLFSYLAEKGVISGGMEVSEDSSGNAGASFAFFSNLAGLKSTVYVSSTSNRKKLEQIRRYGSSINEVTGSRKDVENAAINSGKMYLGHQYWPEFTDGFRSISYEIADQLEHIPDMVYIPFSTGTLYTGIYLGFRHLFRSGRINRIPKLIAVLPEVAAGMHNFMLGIVNNPGKSIADALTGMVPIRHEFLKKVIQEHGSTQTVTEDEIISAGNELLSKGFDVEYSSAVSYAGYKKGHEGKCLLILTGHGIKNIS